MVQVTRIDHMNMDVRDLEVSVRFYRDVFGFEVKERGTYEGNPWAIVGLPAVAYLCMYECPGTDRIESDGLQLNHFGFNVAGFDELEAHLKRLGVPILYDGVVRWPRSRSFYVKDPNGYEIELSEKVGGDLG